MYFSDAYKIQNPIDKDWFNLYLESDTNIYIDPMLVFQSNHPDFSSSAQSIKDFFNEAFKIVALSKGKANKTLRKNALKMLEFKEPKELCIGLCHRGSSGSGIGPNFATRIYDAMVDFIDLGLEEFGEYLSPIEIFVENIGPDRISDIMGNLMKKDLINYTQKVCNKEGIKLEKFLIQNHHFDIKLGIWAHCHADLPKNPGNGKPIILIPKEFLRTNAYLDREDFLEYILHIPNDNLRQQASRLFTLDLNKKQLIEKIRSNQDIAKQLIKEYITKRQSEKAQPYNFKNDPDLINEIPQLIDRLIQKQPKILTMSLDINGLKSFVESIIQSFKKILESNEGFRLMFNDNDNSPKGEGAAQALFWALAEHSCKENGSVEVSPEAQTGKGKVDFKFSQGYSKRIHVEMKLAGSSSLYPGLEKQIPEYLKSDDVDLAFYVVIKQLAIEENKILELKERHRKLSLPENKSILLELVDASFDTKVSASKIK